MRKLGTITVKPRAGAAIEHAQAHRSLFALPWKLVIVERTPSGTVRRVAKYRRRLVEWWSWTW